NSLHYSMENARCCRDLFCFEPRQTRFEVGEANTLASAPSEIDVLRKPVHGRRTKDRRKECIWRRKVEREAHGVLEPKPGQFLRERYLGWRPEMQEVLGSNLGCAAAIVERKADAPARRGRRHARSVADQRDTAGGPGLNEAATRNPPGVPRDKLRTSKTED